MGGGGGAAPHSLQETPTWAVATVCFIFIFLGILIEHLIHLVGHWLQKHRKTALFEAVEKLKSVLMLLGFMSLILTVTQRPISKICVPHRVAYSMLPCRKVYATKTTKVYENVWSKSQNFLPPVEFEDGFHHERILAAAASATSNSSDHCGSKGMTSFISPDGMNQLNIFIFVLAVMQIVYSVLTMALGRAKMRRWKSWEKETETVEYMAANDPERFRFARQTTFGRRHMSACTETPTLLWIKCFFRQFFHSVAKVDYLTLRHGFISAHLSTNKSFNFRKYIQRSLEDDFKVVVGISPFMWFVVVIFLLVDVHGWNVFLWVSFLPLFTVLVIGTKLEVIVARLALRLQDQNSIIRGTPVVQPNDSLFWLNEPKFVLTLLHFTLFMNAFEFAFFIWVTLQFGIKSCYHERVEIIVIRVVLAVMVQVLCSYITLPLYALVTQMGSRFKSTVLHEQTVHALKKWHADVKKKRKNQADTRDPNHYNDYSSTTRSISTNSTPDVSSHRRMPTLAEFASGTGADEIVEEQPHCQQQEIVHQNKEDRILEVSEVSPSDNGDVQIQMPELINAIRQ
nr:MLO-like protein 3 isoform X1 [Coffea arabica]